MITINITDKDGTLLGQVKLTRTELRNASNSAVGALAVVRDIASEAGVR